MNTYAVTQPHENKRECQETVVLYGRGGVCDTFRQRDGDDDAVSCPHPESAAGHHQSRDSHKGEAQFTGTCNTHNTHLFDVFNPCAKDQEEFRIYLKYTDAALKITQNNKTMVR